MNKCHQYRDDPCIFRCKRRWNQALKEFRILQTVLLSTTSLILTSEICCFLLKDGEVNQIAPKHICCCQQNQLEILPSYTMVNIVHSRRNETMLLASVKVLC